MPRSVAIQRCFPATQIFDTSDFNISCEVKCRPYNFYRELKNPAFPCDQTGLNLTFTDISAVPGNTVPIYSTSGELVVAGNNFNGVVYPLCELDKKYGFGESGSYSYTYYLNYYLVE